MMNGTTTPSDAPADPSHADWAGLLEDWITVWQSEMAGLALDREAQEAVLRAIDGWAAQSRAGAGLVAAFMLRAPVERAGGPAGADAAAGATAAAAAPRSWLDAGDARDAVPRRMVERVADLEQRSAAGSGPG